MLSVGEGAEGTAESRKTPIGAWLELGQALPEPVHSEVGAGFMASEGLELAT